MNYFREKMKIKKIQVNGKLEDAYAIHITEKTRTVDFCPARSGLIDAIAAGTATEEEKSQLRELAEEFSPELGVVVKKLTDGTVTEKEKKELEICITSNTVKEWPIYRIVFKEWAYEFFPHMPEAFALKLENIVSIDYEVKQTILDVDLLWSKVKLSLPDGTRVEGSNGGESPKKPLTINELDMINRILKSEKLEHTIIKEASGIKKASKDQFQKLDHDWRIPANAGLKMFNHNRANVPKANTARRRHTNAGIVSILKAYKRNNPTHSLNTALTNLTRVYREKTKDERDFANPVKTTVEELRLNYSSIDKVRARLKKIFAPDSPAEGYRKLKVSTH